MPAVMEADWTRLVPWNGPKHCVGQAILLSQGGPESPEKSWVPGVILRAGFPCIEAKCETPDRTVYVDAARHVEDPNWKHGLRESLLQAGNWAWKPVADAVEMRVQLEDLQVAFKSLDQRVQELEAAYAQKRGKSAA